MWLGSEPRPRSSGADPNTGAKSTRETWRDALVRPFLLPSGLYLRVAVLLLVSGSFLTTVIYNVSNERDLIASEVRRISAVTTVSAKTHTEAVFEATIQLLAALRSDLQRPGASGEQSLLDDHFFGPSYLRAILLLDEKGRMTASSFREVIGNDASHLPLYQVHRVGNEAGVFTGDIIVGNLTRAPHFFSSIGRYDARGNFSGVVAAAYELSYFRDIYKQLVPGPHYAIALFHAEEGLVVASDSEILTGKLPNSSQFPGNAPRNDEGAPTNFKILLDGGETAFTHTQSLDRGPFFVSTMANMDKLLAPHRRATMVKYLLAGLFVLSAIGFTVALELYLHNRRRADADKAQFEGRLRHAQKMEALGTLAGGLAHDFNNLLSSIIGFGELARDRAQANTGARQAVDQILRAGRRAESMVDQILTFSRRADPERKALPLDEVLHEVADLLSISMPPDVEMSLEIGNDRLWTTANPTQLEQVFMNLCTNAVDAMPEGGILKIAADTFRINDAEAERSAVPTPGDYVRVRIMDSGRGIQPDIREHIFDPFFTTKDMRRGTGLGLAITHGIVTAHNGVIDVENIGGGGTCFTVWLPRCAPVAIPEPDPAPAIDGGGRIAIIVDDEPTLVDLAEEQLALLGFEPRGFLSTAEALSAVADSPEAFDLVITDYTMPELNGLELAKAVRLQWPAIPIILMTGLATSSISSQARSSGIAALLSKPLTLRKLEAALCEALPDLCVGSLNDRRARPAIS